MEKLNLSHTSLLFGVKKLSPEVTEYFSFTKDLEGIYFATPKSGKLLRVVFSGESDTSHKYNGVYYILIMNVVRKDGGYSMFFQPLYLSEGGELSLENSLPIPVVCALSDPLYEIRNI